MKFLTGLTQSQIWAQARHYVTFAAGMLATFGIITVSAQPNLVDGAMTLIGSVEKIVAALATAAGAVTLIINTLKASKAASPESAVERVKDIANDPTQPQTAEAKTALVMATNSIPEVQGVVTMPTPAGEQLANSIPVPTVVPAGTEEAVKIAKGEPVL